jgi:hypothetical protein
MATLFISEFRNVVSQQTTMQGQMMGQPALVDQKVTVGSSSTQSNAFSADTHAVLISTDTACSILFGENPTATTDNLRLPADQNPVPFAVIPGQKMAVIANP